MRKNIIAGVLTVASIGVVAGIAVLGVLYPLEILMILVTILVVPFFYCIFSFIKDSL